MSSEHINGYSLALFSLAKEEKKLKQVKEGALTIANSFKENPEYAHLLSSKRLDMDTKEKMVSKAFKGLNKNLINFILLTAKTGKASIVVPVLNKLIKYINQDLKIKEGVVYSAQKLSASEIKKIETKVSKQLGFKPTLVNKLDAFLISGIKVVVDDEVIEDSITSRLEQIKQSLLKEEN